MEQLKYIAFVEPSAIVKEGIISILEKYKLNFQSFWFKSSKELYENISKSHINIIIINSEISTNEINFIKKIKSEFAKAKWIGIISVSQQREFSKIINDSIYINDNEETIYNTINNLLHSDTKSNNFEEVLSERETEVLKLLVQGKMNKEIATELFISIHTVVTHRKNITNKLGIKSTAAMAIYAVANNIIDLNDSLKLLK